MKDLYAEMVSGILSGYGRFFNLIFFNETDTDSRLKIFSSFNPTERGI